MATSKQTNHDDEMGLALEKSFRKAVTESKAHGYVSFTDRPANKSINIPGLDTMARDAKTGRISAPLNNKYLFKKTAKK